MELQQYLTLLRKWIWLIILGVVFAGGVAYLATVQQPPVYRATVTLFIAGNSNEVASDYRAILAAENLVPTYAQQLKSRTVQNEVMRQLGLDTWTSSVSTQQINDTQLLNLHVEDTDPQLAQQIANLIPRAFIQQENDLQQQRLTTAEQTLEQQMAFTQEQIDTTYTTITELQNSDNPNVLEIERLENELYALQASLSTFTHSYQEIRLAQVQMFDPLSISESAELPRKPIGPNVMQNTLLAAVVGGMSAIGVLFLVEYLDNTLKTTDDILHLTGQRPLSTIPHYIKNGTNTPLIAHDQPRSNITEAYRLLRTNIQLRTIDQPAHTILITSSIPGEGKSHLIANLGVVMAHNGLSVILVDTDLRQPTIHNLLEVPNTNGITQALLDDNAHIDNYLQNTRIPHLQVLVAGSLPPNPAELLNSHRMKELITTLRSKADVVLFDAPPALAIADASILATMTDGLIVAVGANQIRPNTLIRTIDSLATMQEKFLGFVLTKFRANNNEQHYYYYTDDNQSKSNRFMKWLKR